MSNLPWIKLYTEIINEDKFYDLDDALKWRFVQLLALAGNYDAEGYLCSPSSTPTSDLLAWKLRVSPEQMKDDLQVLEEHNLICFDEERGAWLIPSFARRQNRLKEDERSEWRERKQRQRDRQAAGKGQNPTQARSGAASSHSEAFAGEEIFPELSSSFTEGNVTDNDAGTAQTEGDNVTDHHSDAWNTVDGNVTLKKRIDKKRGEKRRRAERQSPSPPARPWISPLDQLEQELKQAFPAEPPIDAERHRERLRKAKTWQTKPKSSPRCAN